MSLYDYDQSKVIAGQYWPFHALIMAAMQQADTDNLHELRRAFPHTHLELTLRYHSAGGRLEGDPVVHP
jgi:hypothetical protein